MNEHDSPDLRSLATEPEDLDGHTIEELFEYLESDRTPIDPSIERSAGCRIALEALARLRELTPDLLAADAEEEPEPSESWVQSILSGIALDARSGRRIPITGPTSDADLGLTEGALRGAIRAAERAVPGAVVGRCLFDGEVTVPGSPVRVRVELSAPYGVPIPDLVRRLRTEIERRLKSHTTLNVSAIDIEVRDLHGLPNPTEGQR